MWDKEKSMKVTVDMGNMSEIVQTAIEKNLETIIKEQVEESVKKAIDRVSKDAIDDAVSKNYQRFVDEYIKNTKIKVGGGLWGDRDIKEYTVEEYINHELQKCMDEKTLTVSDRYGKDKKMSFEEYIKKQFNPSTEIASQIDEFMMDVRDDINKSMKECFDESTKSMLSNTVLNILNANDTYRKLESNIKCIASKKE